MSAPDWVADSIFYQVFPDRFANGDPGNDPPNAQAWGSRPTLHGFQGGDLQGILDRFDYLLDLGVNALYLTPIFRSTSNHGYNTTDYLQIEPRLGDDRVFDALIARAHRSGVRVILDGVFNHCGRGFFAFQDLLENQEHSAYRDWFHVRRFPLDACGEGRAENYLAWWGFRSLPKLNTSNSEVRRYLLRVATHWIERGADGWRLDVPNEIDDDSFWAEFRSEVKRVNPEAYLVGEIWEVDPRWVSPGHFDGLMNYPFRKLLLDLVAGGSRKPSEVLRGLEQLVRAYPAEAVHAHYLPLGSHDTERIRTLCGKDLRKVQLLFLALFAFPGAPAIYYGDEVGLEGGKDPDSRRAFPWDPAHWDQPLREHIRQLIRLRKENRVLRRGDFQALFADDASKVIAFSRGGVGERLAVVLHAADAACSVVLPTAGLGWPEGAEVIDLLKGTHHSVAGGQISLSLSPFGGAILRPATA